MICVENIVMIVCDVIAGVITYCITRGINYLVNKHKNNRHGK